MNSPTPTAIVAEESDFHRGGIATILQRKFHYPGVVQVSNKLKLASELQRHKTVSLLAADLDLLDDDAPDLIRRWRRASATMRILVFSAVPQQQQILELLAAGANGVVPSSVTGAELKRALEIVIEGGIYVPAALRGNADVPPSVPQSLAGLTERQREVLFLLSQGYSNKVIARKLDISPATVKVHVHALFPALGVHTRLGAVAALDGWKGRIERKAPELARLW